MLASEIMDQSAIYLNDSQKNLYSYSVQTPYLQLANETLQNLLLTYGVAVERVKSSTIAIPIGTTAIVVNAGVGQTNLPTDFLLPISILERAAASGSPWVKVTEQTWEEDSITATTEIRYWAFRNNGIYFPSVGCTVAREVLIRYERSLATVSGQNSVIDSAFFKNYLSAKTAELCARLIGMNSSFADEIKGVYADVAEDSLTRNLVLNQQGIPQRRMRFGTKRLTTIG